MITVVDRGVLEDAMVHPEKYPDLALVMRNLETIVDSGKQVVLRLPCIPDYNLTDDHFHRTYGLSQHLGIGRLDLLPYHTLGMEKYRQLRRPYPYVVTQSLSPMALEPYRDMGKAMGLDVRIGV